MKRLLFFILIVFAVSLSAQKNNSYDFECMINAVNSGNFDRAIYYAEKILKSDRSEYGEKHPEYAGSLVNLGQVYYYKGDYAKAESNYLKALNIYKSKVSKDNPGYVACLNNLGNLYSDMTEYSKAESIYKEVLDISRAKYGEKHEQTAKAMHGLGGVYRMKGDYAKAEHYCLEACKIMKSVLGENHAQYAVTLNGLGDLYVAMGDYVKAESCYLDMIKIRKSMASENPMLYASSLASLATTYVNMGKYSQAEENFLEALEIYKKNVDKYNLDYAVCVNNLASLYSYMGAYSQAEPYFLEVLEIRNTVLGENHLDCTSPLHNLGSIYHLMGEYSKAEQCHEKALKILEVQLGKNHPDYLLTLHNVANLYRDMGKYTQAESYYLHVSKTIKSLVGENHPFYATCVNNMALLYCKTKQYSQSETQYRKALYLRKKLLGESHPYYALTLYGMGQLYSDKGDYAKANEFFTEARAHYKEQYLSSLGFMTEQQRKSYWTTMEEHYDKTYPQYVYKYYASQPSVAGFAYDNELFRKGLLLSSSDAIRRSILESGNSTLINQWNQLTSLKQEIVFLEESDPQSAGLKRIRYSADSLEKIITRVSATYRAEQAMWQISWDDVRRQLSSNEVAIEYFSVATPDNSTMYCALLLRSNSQYPTLIPLFKEKEVESLLSGNVNDIYSYNVNGKKLSQAIWGKILPEIKSGETIYFSAAGVLHQVAIEYLPYTANLTMSDMFTLVRLSSTRELALNKTSVRNSVATIYGGIQYSMYADELLLESEPYQAVSAGMSRDVMNVKRGTVQYLPGTRVEAETINMLMKKNNITTRLYTDTKANEESFKALSGKRNHILHIGTHGFTWTNSTAQNQDYFAQRGQQGSGQNIDPLTRCGLLFAGSNIALSGRAKELDKGVQDGILTSKEISLLNLRGTDLVILSACETAKGDITSEGVFGLQRAFKMAGVQTIIMSLWKVDDQATQLLMTEFYSNWIGGKSQSKREAFKKAQKTVKTKYPSPEYWAGFILLD